MTAVVTTIGAEIRDDLCPWGPLLTHYEGAPLFSVGFIRRRGPTERSNPGVLATIPERGGESWTMRPTAPGAAVSGRLFGSLRPALGGIGDRRSVFRQRCLTELAIENH
jgi:hypothetical protein